MWTKLSIIWERFYKWWNDHSTFKGEKLCFFSFFFYLCRQIL